MSDSEDTILRCEHNRENPYAQISKEMLRDKSISPKSKGVLCYLLSLPDNWQTHPKQVAEALGVGKDQIYWVLDELIREGYATKKVSKGERGQFGSVQYIFREIKIKSTVSGSPDTVSPDTVTQTLQNTYVKEDKKEQQQQTPALPKESVVVVSSENVVVKKILLDIGFDAKTISELEHFSQDVILTALEAYNEAVKKKKPIVNKLGWIRNAITNSWKPSKDEEVTEFDPSAENKKFANELYNTYNGQVGKLKFKVRDLFVELCVDSFFDNLCFKEKDFQEKLTSIIKSYKIVGV